jgi:hypothetical protein
VAISGNYNESPFNLLMQKSDLLSLYDAHMRINLHLPGVPFERSARIVRDLDPATNSGFIDHAALDDATADAEIDAQIVHFKALNVPFTWKVHDHDQPADLRQRLAARGYYTGLLAARAREAHARGVRFLAVDASSMSASILARYGFTTFEQTTYYRWSPG